MKKQKDVKVGDVLYLEVMKEYDGYYFPGGTYTIEELEEEDQSIFEEDSKIMEVKVVREVEIEFEKSKTRVRITGVNE